MKTIKILGVLYIAESLSPLLEKYLKAVESLYLQYGSLPSGNYCKKCKTQGIGTKFVWHWSGFLFCDTCEKTIKV
jgi:hypothetical protein